MRFNNWLTEADSMKMAKAMKQCFFIAGYGHFDISIEESAKLLRVAYNESSEPRRAEKVKEFYEEMQSKYMGDC